MISVLGAALLAGLVGSPHCVGMCGGFAVACGDRRSDLLGWHGGRLTTYAILGLFAGTLGSGLSGLGLWGAGVSTVLIVWFAAALAGWAPEPKMAVPGLSSWMVTSLHKRGASSKYMFGLANGLLPCGLVYAALSLPVAAASPWAGALVMVAFGLGTLPALSAVTLGLRRVALRSIWARRLLAAVVLVTGLWAIAMRQGMGLMPGSGH
jgi:sulfite exporter TauE/SafE